MIKTLQEQTKIMKILANQNRIHLLVYIADAKTDLCVNQLSEKVGISQSLASHQLAYLSSRSVIEGYRVGQTMCYKPSETEFAKRVFEVVGFLSK